MPHTAAFFSQQLTFSSHSDFPVSADVGIDIYLFNSNNIASEQITELAAQYLHPQEQVIFAKRKQPQAKQEYLTSRVIIKTYASQCLGYNFDSLAVLFDDKDTCLKVYQHGEVIALHSCISHSHGQVLVALVPVKHAATQALTIKPLQLGVDLEWISTKRSLEKIAKHYYHSDELHACMGQVEAVAEEMGKAVHAKALYRIWTLKEALAKAIKQPIAKLLRDNVFEHCQQLHVHSGCYEAVEQAFDISIISNLEVTDNTSINTGSNTHVGTDIKVLTALFNHDLRSVK
ncbi:4'-phosphopantetheinyl transferase family protein [Moritella yayanosii]|uniref:4'-phosphopantetheinyl transferase domain-containing protein n=1 Tax=Moritella yayanosii TaxID=69539 RepID=A0A330LWB9_9GAMM|nr:4'-phosphopantetheinyl transferase superfamily protein [Moritella yayanosii]SQD80532.1 conserved protein of unknown function [Moritella yayanosii]